MSCINYTNNCAFTLCLKMVKKQCTFPFDACPIHSPFRFGHLTHRNFSARALFCHNSFAKVITQILRPRKKLFGCTLPTNPNVQGRLNIFFFFFKFKFFPQKIKFFHKNGFSSKFQSTKLTPKNRQKNLLFFTKYSWQALLLCNKSFDHLEILVFDSTLSFKTTKCTKKNYLKKKSNRPTLSFFLETCNTTKQLFFYWPNQRN